jgi:hypothetical protein
VPFKRNLRRYNEVKALLKTLPSTRAEGRFEMLVNVDSRSDHAMWLAAMGPDDWHGLTLVLTLHASTKICCISCHY